MFAKNDQHAEDIVKIIREEFGKGNDFCQKITSKTPKQLLAEFRNSFHPRIAVTVDMIATGTDVKPLECLLFLRNINSATYFEQMKGRGSRVVDPDTLWSVTPDAQRKTRFVIVDAVGVCERDKTPSKPLDRQPSVPLEKVLDAVAKGIANADVVSTLASRLTRLEQQISPVQQQEIAAVAGGKSLATLCHNLLGSLDPDANTVRAAERFGLPADQPPTDEQLDQAEQAAMRDALRPFHQPELREAVINIKRSLEQVIDEITPDELLSAGYDAQALEKVKTLITDFRQFIEDNKDQIEALQLLYSHPYRAGLRYRHVKELADSGAAETAAVGQSGAVVASVPGSRTGRGPGGGRPAVGRSDRPGPSCHRPEPAVMSHRDDRRRAVRAVAGRSASVGRNVYHRADAVAGGHPRPRGRQSEHRPRRFRIRPLQPIRRPGQSLRTVRRQVAGNAGGTEREAGGVGRIWQKD